MQTTWYCLVFGYLNPMSGLFLEMKQQKKQKQPETFLHCQLKYLNRLLTALFALSRCTSVNNASLILIHRFWLLRAYSPVDRFYLCREGTGLIDLHVCVYFTHSIGEHHWSDWPQWYILMPANCQSLQFPAPHWNIDVPGKWQSPQLSVQKCTHVV